MAITPIKPPPSTDNNAKKTQPKWNGPEDARKMKGAGTYPNYHEQKTRSGHTFIFDDSNGAESITLQHRTGSMIQMMPDGAVQIVTHNGQYNLVFGENRVMVTGAHDVTVLGAASLYVDGDYNTTIRGNHNITADGDVNITAQNMNTTIRGNMETAAKTMSTKLEGPSMITSQGNMYIASSGDLMIGSTEGAVGIGASGIVGIRSVASEVAIQGQEDVSIKSDGGKILQQAADNVSIKSGGDFKLQTSGQISLKGGSLLSGDAPSIWWNSGKSVSAETAKAAGDITLAQPSSQPDKEQDNFTKGAPTKADYIST